MKTEQLLHRVTTLRTDLQRIVESSSQSYSRADAREALDELDHLEADLRALVPDVCTIEINATTLQHVQAIKEGVVDSAPYVNAPQTVQRALPLVTALEFEIRTALESWKKSQPAGTPTAALLAPAILSSSVAPEPGTRRYEQLVAFTHTALQGLLNGRDFEVDREGGNGDYFSQAAVAIAAATVKRLNGGT